MLVSVCPDVPFTPGASLRKKPETFCRKVNSTPSSVGKTVIDSSPVSERRSPVDEMSNQPSWPDNASVISMTAAPVRGLTAFTVKTSSTGPELLASSIGFSGSVTAEPEYAECRKGTSGYSVGAVDLGRQRQTAVQERICNFEVNAAVDPANGEYAGPPVGIGGRETFVSAGGIRCRGESGAYASQYERQV